MMSVDGFEDVGEKDKKNVEITKEGKEQIKKVTEKVVEELSKDPEAIEVFNALGLIKKN